MNDEIMGVLTGMLIGIMAGLLIHAWIQRGRRRQGIPAHDYDERQDQITLTAEHLAFRVMLWLCFIDIIVECISVPIQPAVMVFLTAMIGVAVSVGYRILHGSYFHLHGHPKRFMWFIGIIGLVNLVIFMDHFRTGDFFYKGQLSFIATANGIVLIPFVTVLITAWLSQKREDEEA